jgi:hypothetical protein
MDNNHDAVFEKYVQLLLAQQKWAIHGGWMIEKQLSDEAEIRTVLYGIMQRLYRIAQHLKEHPQEFTKYLSMSEDVYKVLVEQGFENLFVYIFSSDGTISRGNDASEGYPLIMGEKRRF